MNSEAKLKYEEWIEGIGFQYIWNVVLKHNRNDVKTELYKKVWAG